MLNLVFEPVQAWPEDALELVGHKFLENVDIGSNEKLATVDICKLFHTSAKNLSPEYVE